MIRGYFQNKLFPQKVSFLNSEKYKSSQMDLNYSLLRAVEQSNYDLILNLLRQGADINLKFKYENTSYFTLLSKALNIGDLSLIQILLDNNIDIDEPYGKQNNTALIQAVFNNNYELAKILLAYGANPNFSNSIGGSALTCAAGKNLKMLELLIEYKGDVNVSNIDVIYDTPLTFAIKQLNDQDALSIVKKLIEHGADIEGVNKSGQTALMTAIDYENIPVIIELIKCGAFVSEYKSVEDKINKIIDDEVTKLKVSEDFDLLMREIELYVFNKDDVETSGYLEEIDE